MLEELLRDSLTDSAALLSISCAPGPAPSPVCSIGNPVLAMNSTGGGLTSNSSSVSVLLESAGSSIEDPSLLFQRTTPDRQPSSIATSTPISPSTTQLFSLFQPTTAAPTTSSADPERSAANISAAAAEDTANETDLSQIFNQPAEQLSDVDSAAAPPGLVQVLDLPSVHEALGSNDRAMSACCGAGMVAVGTVKGSVHVLTIEQSVDRPDTPPTMGLARSYRGVDPTAVVSVAFSARRPKEQLLAVLHESGLVFFLSLGGSHNGSCVASAQPPQVNARMYSLFASGCCFM